MLSALTHSTPTLAEQVVAAELAYYRQIEQCSISETDVVTWNRSLRRCEEALISPLAPLTYAFVRHVLERQRCSLHTYMARQLSEPAWAYWFMHGGVIDSFREPIAKQVAAPIINYHLPDFFTWHA